MAERVGSQTVDDLVVAGDADRDAPLDVDFNSEDFHQDSAADRMMGWDGGLAMEGESGSSGRRIRRKDPDFDSLGLRAKAARSGSPPLRPRAGACLSGQDLLIAKTGRRSSSSWRRPVIIGLVSSIFRSGSGAPLHQVEQVPARSQTFDPAG
jgi:hypothetical protein